MAANFVSVVRINLTVQRWDASGLMFGFKILRILAPGQSTKSGGTDFKAPRGATNCWKGAREAGLPRFSAWVPLRFLNRSTKTQRSRYLCCGVPEHPHRRKHRVPDSSDRYPKTFCPKHLKLRGVGIPTVQGEICKWLSSNNLRCWNIGKMQLFVDFGYALTTKCHASPIGHKLYYVCNKHIVYY